jgi:alpha-L-rhamnosidase
MKSHQLSIIGIIACCFVACSGAQFDVYDLKVENRANPLGIDVAAPRFSWKIKSGVNGERQTARHILVASTEALLNDNRADLWDSGLTASDESTLVPYSGVALQSGAVAYWKVLVVGADGKAIWSKPARFSVGLLSGDDWQGDYIAFPASAGDPQSPLLRKTFAVNDKCDLALLHVNSLGYHEVYINGTAVSDEALSPAVSQFNKRSLARTYDVSSLLKRGKNEIVVWLSRGWYQTHFPGVVYEGPTLRAQLETLTADKRAVVLVTDATWKTRESGCTLTRRWGYNSFGGERIDANVVPSKLSFSDADCDGWVGAVKVDVPEHVVSPQMCEGNVFTETCRAKIVRQLADSVWLFDLGNTLTGMTEVRFAQLSKNQAVRLAYTDHLNDDDEFYDQGQEDVYIASGVAGEIFRNKFNYHSYRYLKISGIDAAPVEISARMLRTGYDDAASFVCSDNDMNAIHDLVRHALHCLSLGGYIVDCNHFERLGYGGDGHASTLTSQTMFAMPSLYANWLQAWGDCIRDDGGLPHTAPNPYGAGGGPYWCAFIVAAPWNCYLNYGDVGILEKYYPVMKHWLQYVDKYTVDGLLKSWGDTDYRAWYLGDWATPKGVDQTNPASIELVANCVISDCYVMLGKIAAILGKNSDVDDFVARKKALDDKIHNSFYSSDSCRYATGSQIDNIYPMLVGATPPELTAALTRRVFADTENRYGGKLATGLVGIPVLVEWAIKNNCSEFVYAMLKKRDYPGYLYMIDRGATATWEHWDGKRSHIHNCYNAIGAWFYQAIGGIQPLEAAPGYRKVRIAPQIPDKLTWAETTKETPCGTLIVNWIKTDGEVQFDISVPVGCTAEFEWNGEKTALESGKYVIVKNYK